MKLGRPAKKLNENKVKQILTLLKKGKMTQTEIARKYKITSSYVSMIKYKLNWREINI